MPDAELGPLRIEIDAIDEQLVELLARRFQVTARVGAVKKRLALQPIDTEREARQARYDQLMQSLRLRFAAGRLDERDLVEVDALLRQ